VRKLLFMTDPEEIATKVKPQIEEQLIGTGAESTQAVDSMLEVVPEGGALSFSALALYSFDSMRSMLMLVTLCRY
jgi:hypothetical protein